MALVQPQPVIQKKKKRRKKVVVEEEEGPYKKLAGMLISGLSCIIHSRAR